MGEGEREKGGGGGGGGGGREKGQDKTDSFHWHGEPDVVQAYSYRVTLLYGNAVGACNNTTSTLYAIHTGAQHRAQ